MARHYDAAGVSLKAPRKARSEWVALVPNTHEGYVSWEKAETIRKMVNSNVLASRHHGAPKHGDALLAGLLRCGRCGRKLTLVFALLKSRSRCYCYNLRRSPVGEMECLPRAARLGGGDLASS